LKIQVALVHWTEQVGVKLANRDLATMQLELSNGKIKQFHILHLFPFTSESKRMGIIGLKFYGFMNEQIHELSRNAC
jgi:magnesium-transporting ATPase (P-type)